MAGEAESGAGPDRKRYAITATGKSEVEAWLAEPIPAEPHVQTDLFVKVMLSLMLGRPAEEYLDAQRAAHLRRMRELTELKQRDSLVDALLADHGLFHLEADLRWIDLTAARLAALARRWRRERGERLLCGQGRRRDHRGTDLVLSFGETPALRGRASR